jgi:hypothetical protein
MIAKSDPESRAYNQAESLSLGELETVAAGRAALASHKTFDVWVVIGRALQALRDKANRVGGRQTFRRLLAQNGFAMDGKAKILDPAVATKLLAIMDNLPEVIRWYESLPRKEKGVWSAPTTIYKNCPVFNKGETKPAAKAQLKEVRRREDDGIKLSGTAKDIAATMVGTLPESKAEAVARHILGLVRERNLRERARG